MVLALAAAAHADPLAYTMRVTESGTSVSGDPQAIVGFMFGNGAGSFANTIDALTPVLLAAANSGTLLDAVEFVGFDAGHSPPTYIGTYAFTGVLITSLIVTGTTVQGSFTAEAATFVPVSEPATLYLLAAIPLMLLVRRRSLRCRRRSIDLVRRNLAGPAPRA
jgi:hypothetical protein